MITFELVTLDGLKHSEECYEVILPTTEGQISIFPHHAALVSVAAPGIVKVRKRATDKDETMETFAVDGGVVEINDKRVRLLVDEAEQAADINAAHAKEALERARKLLAESDSRESSAQAMARIERELARIRVAEIKRRRSNR